MATFIQGRALVIGVGADLPNTVADAQGIAELLTDPTLCAYPPAQVTMLTCEAATRTGMLTALDQLVQATGAEWVVIAVSVGAMVAGTAVLARAGVPTPPTGTEAGSAPPSPSPAAARTGRDRRS